MPIYMGLCVKSLQNDIFNIRPTYINAYVSLTYTTSLSPIGIKK